MLSCTVFYLPLLLLAISAEYISSAMLAIETFLSFLFWLVCRRDETEFNT